MRFNKKLKIEKFKENKVAAIFDLGNILQLQIGIKIKCIKRLILRIYSLIKPITILLNSTGLLIKGT